MYFFFQFLLILIKYLLDWVDDTFHFSQKPAIHNIYTVHGSDGASTSSNNTPTAATTSTTQRPAAVQSTLIRKVQFSNENFVMGDHVDAVNGGEAVPKTDEERGANFLVGEDGETVQEAHEAVDEFPTKLQNGKYSSEDVAERRKRLR